MHTYQPADVSKHDVAIACYLHFMLQLFRILFFYFASLFLGADSIPKKHATKWDDLFTIWKNSEETIKTSSMEDSFYMHRSAELISLPEQEVDKKNRGRLFGSNHRFHWRLTV